jgi:cell division protein FtsW (lipid II flippase)
MDHDHKHDRNGGNKMKSRTKWVFIGFALIAAYFVITEHRAHVTTWLAQYGIFLLLLACPLLHMFMHGGHGGHGDHKQSDKGDRRE